VAEEIEQVEPFEEAHFVRLHDWATSLRQDDLPFYARLVREHGSPVLDVACATGRVDIPLARQGAEVVGLVCSQAALELVRGKVESEPPDVRARLSFIRAGMEEFDLGRQFRTVIVPDSAVFALRGRYSLTQCFRRLYRHTAPGGVAVVDVVAPSVMADREVGRRVDVAEGVNPATGLPTRLTTRVTNILWDMQVIAEVQTYVEGEGDEEREFAFRLNHRWLGRDEGLELLQRAGFPEVDVLGDYEGAPYGDGSRRLILLAHRLERDFI